MPFALAQRVTTIAAPARRRALERHPLTADATESFPAERPATRAAGWQSYVAGTSGRSRKPGIRFEAQISS
jgi:hypothetical protein